MELLSDREEDEAEDEAHVTASGEGEYVVLLHVN